MTFVPPSQRPPRYVVGHTLYECSPFHSGFVTVTRDEKFGYVWVRRDETGEDTSVPLQHLLRQPLPPTR